jgi:hypothetical protein
MFEIRDASVDPVVLTAKFFQDLEETKEQRGRFVASGAVLRACNIW